MKGDIKFNSVVLVENNTSGLLKKERILRWPLNVA